MKHIFSKQNRALLGELVRTDFKLRYQNSVLGYAWSLLRPLLLFLILYLVFTQVFNLGKDIEHFPVYLLLGIVLWNFFAEMTTMSLGSIVGRGIKIPRWIIILSSSMSATINLGLNMVVVAIFMAVNHVQPTALALVLPLLIVELYIFSAGVSLFLSAAYVKYRDVSYIWEVIMQVLFYATPIIYPLSRVHVLAQKKMQDARYGLVTHQTETINQVFGGGWYRFIPFVIVAITMLIGVLYFKRESKYFAENI
jgi:ABC-2 type transport system permease protein